jgi:P27 family predicted phage terminase small subunit
MAPRPIPSYLKLLRGNPGRRPINRHEPQPELPPEPPPCPEFLGAYARAEWERVSVELFRLRLLTTLDLMSLAGYCQAYQTWRTATETLSSMASRDPVMSGLIVRTQAGNGAANPLIWIAASASRDMLKFAAEFGMSPASRTRISVDAAAGATGKFNGLIGG